LQPVAAPACLIAGEGLPVATVSQDAAIGSIKVVWSALPGPDVPDHGLACAYAGVALNRFYRLVFGLAMPRPLS